MCLCYRLSSQIVNLCVIVRFAAPEVQAQAKFIVTSSLRFVLKLLSKIVELPRASSGRAVTSRMKLAGILARGPGSLCCAFESYI